VLDDAHVSRKHARFRLVGDAVEVSDLESRNGVLVNGARIQAPTLLRHGDRVRVGEQELVLRDSLANSVAKDGTSEFRLCEGCGTLVAPAARICPSCRSPLSGPTPTMEIEVSASATPTANSLSSFSMLCGIADKALSMGRNEEAARILEGMLHSVLNNARSRPSPPDEQLRIATTYALKLAEALESTHWIDYIFDLYTAVDRIAAAELIDELYRLTRKLKHTQPLPIRRYVESLKPRTDSMAPNERFLMQRLLGLERMVATGR
jgi:hypothetical protein